MRRSRDATSRWRSASARGSSTGTGGRRLGCSRRTRSSLTSMAALDLLGAAYRFRTVAATDGRVRDGVLRGDLWLVGGGDPDPDDDGPLRTRPAPRRRRRPPRDRARPRRHRRVRSRMVGAGLAARDLASLRGAPDGFAPVRGGVRPRGRRRRRVSGVPSRRRDRGRRRLRHGCRSGRRRSARVRSLGTARRAARTPEPRVRQPLRRADDEAAGRHRRGAGVDRVGGPRDPDAGRPTTASTHRSGTGAACPIKIEPPPTGS